MKTIQFQQHFSTTTFRHLTKKNYGFKIHEHFVGPLYHACTLQSKMRIKNMV